LVQFAVAVLQAWKERRKRLVIGALAAAIVIKGAMSHSPSRAVTLHEKDRVMIEDFKATLLLMGTTFFASVVFAATSGQSIGCASFA
jgi:hypothetical protein